MENDFINEIKNAIYNTHKYNIRNMNNNLLTNCDENVFNIIGMSGRKTRILYNNICNKVNEWYEKNYHKSINYLEIGAHRGSSTIASLYKNPNIKATIIDNWSEFGNCQHILENNLRNYANENEIQLINEDSFFLQTDLKFKPYQVYLYDGCHKTESHKKGIIDFVKYLDNLSVIIVDDYSWKQVKDGTLQGLNEINNTHELIYSNIIEDENNKLEFWNGVGIFAVRKKK